MCLWNMHLDFFTVCLDVCQWISKIVLWWLGGDFGGKLRWFHGEIGRPPSQNQPSQGHSPLYLQSSLLLWSLQCHYIFQEVLYLFHFIVGSWQKWWCCSPHSRWQTFIFFLKKEVWKPRLLRRDEALLSAIPEPVGQLTAHAVPQLLPEHLQNVLPVLHQKTPPTPEKCAPFLRELNCLSQTSEMPGVARLFSLSFSSP